MLHRHYPASQLILTPPTPKRSRHLAYGFAKCVGFHPNRWASQVPRSIFRYAPSPTTPGCHAGAYTRCFPTRYRLHQLWETSHIHFSVTRPNRVRFTTAHTCASGGFDEWVTPSRRSVSYTCERAIHMVDSFHSTRLTRLNLAHQSTQRKTIQIPDLPLTSLDLLCITLRSGLQPAALR